MDNSKKLIHINVQTNCNISFSLLTIEELVHHASSNKINSLAICDYNPYEFLKFYYLCKDFNIKPIWGFKRVVSYEGYQLNINLFPRKYSEYRELNKILYGKNKSNVLDLLSLRNLVSQCLLVLEVRNYNEISLAFKLKSEELLSSTEEGDNYQDIYIGLNFLPTQIKILKVGNIREKLLPFFSVKSLDWKDHSFLASFARTNFASGFSDVYLESIPYLEKKELIDYFGSKWEQNADESFSEFFNRLSANLESFTSKIHLLLRKNLPTEKKGEFELLKKQCEKNLVSLINNEKFSSYSEILAEELKVIKTKGYANYFLELAKITKIFSDNKVEMGPGRGSAASSLVSYVLGLTSIDPVANKLFFWRFLNEKRDDFPDVDIDIENQEFALQLIAKEYGRQSVAKLIVKKKIGWRTAMSSSLKIFKIEERESAYIEENFSLFLDTSDENKIPMKVKYLLEKYHEAFSLAKRIYNLYSGVSPHASGIIISNEKLSEKLPIKDEGIFPICLYQQKYTSNLGFKKFDFLSLTESLSFVKFIKEKNPSRVPLYMDLNMKDRKTWNLLRDGLLMGVFQINTRLFAEIINVFQPNNFSDLLMVIAVNRPGASISIKEIEQIRSSNENDKNKQIGTKELSEILSSTYGRIIFEEQISQILAYCLDVSFAEAELIRRKLKFIIKDDNEKRKFKLNFISKTTGKLETFEKDLLWEKIIKSVPYLFNKAHATSYTYLTYYTAYLKANFSTDSFIYLLHRSNNDHKSIVAIAEEAVLAGYRLEIPNINTSSWEWKVETRTDGNSIIIGFSQLGANFHSFFDKVIEERSKNGIFKNWKDMLARLSYSFDSLKNEDLSLWVDLGLFRNLPGNVEWINIHLSSLKRYARIVGSLQKVSDEHLPFLLPSGWTNTKHSLSIQNKREWEIFHFYPSYLTRWRRISSNNPHYIEEKLRSMVSINDVQLGNLDDGKMKVHAVLTSIKKIGDRYSLTILLFNFSLEIFCELDFYEKQFTSIDIHSEAIFTLENRKEKLKNAIFVDNVGVYEKY